MATQVNQIYQPQAQFQPTYVQQPAQGTNIENFTLASHTAVEQSNQQHAQQFQPHLQHQPSYIAQPQQQSQPQTFQVSQPIPPKIVYQAQNNQGAPPVGYEFIMVPQSQPTNIAPAGQQHILIQAQPQPVAGPGQQMYYVDQANMASVPAAPTAFMPSFVQHQPSSCYIQFAQEQPQLQQTAQQVNPVIHQSHVDPQGQISQIQNAQTPNWIQPQYSNDSAYAPQGLQNYGALNQNMSNPNAKPYKSSPLTFYDQMTNSSSYETIRPGTLHKQSSTFSKMSGQSFHNRSPVPNQYQSGKSTFKLSNRLLKLTTDLNQKDSIRTNSPAKQFKSKFSVSDFNPKPHNSTHDKLFQDLTEPPSKGQPKKQWSRFDSQLTSETAQSHPTDHEEGNEQTQQQDALNQTVIEILSSLSEKSDPRIKINPDKEVSVNQQRHPLMRKLTTNDRERVAHFYDKSRSMNAPKPSNVPIF